MFVFIAFFGTNTHQFRTRRSIWPESSGSNSSIAWSASRTKSAGWPAPSGRACRRSRAQGQAWRSRGARRHRRGSGAARCRARSPVRSEGAHERARHPGRREPHRRHPWPHRRPSRRRGVHGPEPSPSYWRLASLDSFNGQIWGADNKYSKAGETSPDDFEHSASVRVISQEFDMARSRWCGYPQPTNPALSPNVDRQHQLRTGVGHAHRRPRPRDVGRSVLHHRVGAASFDPALLALPTSTTQTRFRTDTSGSRMTSRRRPPNSRSTSPLAPRTTTSEAERSRTTSRTTSPTTSTSALGTHPIASMPSWQSARAIASSSPARSRPWPLARNPGASRRRVHLGRHRSRRSEPVPRPRRARARLARGLHLRQSVGCPSNRLPAAVRRVRSNGPG